MSTMSRTIHTNEEIQSPPTHTGSTHHNTGMPTQQDAQSVDNNSTLDREYANTIHNATDDNSVSYDKYYTMIHH